MKIIHFICLLICLSSCASTTIYTPKLSLDISPKKIDKTVRFEKLENLSPVEYTETPFRGVCVTNPKSLLNSLDVEVTNAIVSDFHLNGVFKNVSRNVDSPDFIIKGSIKKFYGKSQFNNFGMVTYITSLSSMFFVMVGGLRLMRENIKLGGDFDFLILAPLIVLLPQGTWLLGIPIKKIYSEVEITLNVYDSKNNFIKTYTAKDFNKQQFNIYNDKSLEIYGLTNKTFSNVIMNIREQIITDKEMLEK